MTASLLNEFPQPADLIKEAFGDLQLAGSADPRDNAKVGPLWSLPRPWDPPSCTTTTLRFELWRWLDKVAEWVTQEYIWQPDRVIPACWPAHPPIVHDLATLASVRYAAGLTNSADALENWHREALPNFFTRIATRAAGSPCRPGVHKAWPAAGRLADYRSETAMRSRLEAFEADATGRYEVGST